MTERKSHVDTLTSWNLFLDLNVRVTHQHQKQEAQRPVQLLQNCAIITGSIDQVVWNNRDVGTLLGSRMTGAQERNEALRKTLMRVAATVAAFQEQRR